MAKKLLNMHHRPVRGLLPLIMVLSALALIYIPGFCSGSSEKALEGDWSGALSIQGGARLSIVFHFKMSQAGVLTGTMDSPDQGAFGIPMSRISVSGRKVELTVPSCNGSFTGTVGADGAALTGEWTQAGGALPLTLKKGAKSKSHSRPQDPAKPYPYNEEEFFFTNSHDGVKLAGTLTCPKDKGKHGAVLLITGSGPQNRNEEVFNHRPFLVLSDYLTRKGFVVLRYDDRGVGKSGGNFSKATTTDFVNDAAAGVLYLKTRPEVKPGRIGLIGHSEGGIVSSILASLSADVAFVVLMAGPGVRGDEIIVRQTEKLSRLAGASQEVAAGNGAIERKILNIVEREKDDTKAAAELRSLMAQIQGNDPSKKAAMEQEIKGLLSPWYRNMLTLDPAVYLSRVKCPVLALNGEKDCQVDPEQNLPAIEKALKAAGNGNFTVREMPGLNHLFQKAKTGALSEYASIDETINPAVLQLIAAWLDKICR